MVFPTCFGQAFQIYALPVPSACFLTRPTCAQGSHHSSRDGSLLPWKQSLIRKSCLPPRSTFPSLSVRALQGSQGQGPRRLVDVIRLIPEFSKNYFKSPFRGALFGGISLLGGFYVAQTISLSFGALGVNDVIAAVLCVILTEYVTKFYYSRSKVTFPVALLIILRWVLPMVFSSMLSSLPAKRHNLVKTCRFCKPRATNFVPVLV